MKMVSFQISDEDYDDLVQHMARDRAGKPLVGVVGGIDPTSFLGQDIAAAKAAIEGAQVPAPEVGDLVLLRAAGLHGQTTLAGTVKRVLDNGLVEVKTQQHGYFTRTAAQLTVQRKAVARG